MIIIRYTLKTWFGLKPNCLWMVIFNHLFQINTLNIISLILFTKFLMWMQLPFTFSYKMYTTLELVSLNSPFQSCLPFSRHFHRGSWRLTIVGNQTKNRFRDVPHTIIKETSNTTTPELNHRGLNMVENSALTKLTRIVNTLHFFELFWSTLLYHL